ncbi:MAG TPA: SMP-30/gluconolactonase/LRE family protein [Vicinamibacterales bacterium]|nr:SMP-30/gluconolactonase/LRE family protein [Vicinamibacterales bacterium]
MSAANGLSPDEKTLYVTNGGVVIAFDVGPDGALTRQREFGKLRGGQGGDGSAVDAQGRLYVSTGASVDVFTPAGEFLGSIVGPQGLHGTAFGGRDEDALRHRLLRHVGHGQRAKPGDRDSDDHGGL